MRLRPTPFVLLLIVAASVVAPAGADIRTGKLTMWDMLSAAAQRTHTDARIRTKAPAAICSMISSPDPEEAALARRFSVLGLCQPSSESSTGSAPAKPETAIAGPSIVQGQGACSVIGKVGQSC